MTCWRAIASIFYPTSQTNSIMCSIHHRGETLLAFLPKQTRDFNPIPSLPYSHWIWWRNCKTHTVIICIVKLAHIRICSSHANDLALQIAEEVTGHSEVVVLDGAYHGHTKPLMGLSTYKSRQQKEGESGIGSNPHAWIVSGYEQFIFLVTKACPRMVLLIKLSF